MTIEVSGNPDVVHETNENDNTLTLTGQYKPNPFSFKSILTVS